MTVTHLIINEIGKFNVKVDVMPNGLEKYMAFTINKILIFVDSMQFMNSSQENQLKFYQTMIQIFNPRNWF